MGKKIPLGKSIPGSTTGVIEQPQTTEGRIAVLESQLEAMTKAFYETRAALAEKERGQNAYVDPIDFNRDGVPINTSYIGIVNGVPHILTVGEDGNYYIGNIQYTSLSAAASAVGAPVRKSGWRFWKAADGQSMKQVFRS